MTEQSQCHVFNKLHIFSPAILCFAGYAVWARQGAWTLLLPVAGTCNWDGMFNHAKHPLNQE
jgi:hypothetical protein